MNAYALGVLLLVVCFLGPSTYVFLHGASKHSYESKIIHYEWECWFEEFMIDLDVVLNDSLFFFLINSLRYIL